GPGRAVYLATSCGRAGPARKRRRAGPGARAAVRPGAELHAVAEREVVLRHAVLAQQALVVEEARTPLGQHYRHAQAQTQVVGIERVAADQHGAAGRVVQEARLDRLRVVL